MSRTPLHLKFLAPILAAALTLGSAATTHAAEKMDVETHSLLIGKLERVLEHGNAADVANLEVRLRLADLLAERARLHALKQEGRVSAAGRADRRAALGHYQAVVNKVDAGRRAVVLMQIAHLHESMGESAKAVAVYSRIIREGTRVYPRSTVAQAFSGLGDILYRQGAFAKAMGKFKAAFPLSERDRQGYVMYRMAWCELNLGQLERATGRLVDILRTPELLTRKSTTGSDIDASFHEDVARDLVTFIARGDITPGKINLLMELSPDHIRRDNIRGLAQEAERLGKKHAAISVWAMILEDNPSDVERIEVRIHLAILEWGLNRKRDAADQLELALEAWKKSGCDDKDECERLKGRARKLITDWNRLEKDRVTPELARAYAVYNRGFDDEYDMHFWAAQVSRLLKRYNDASGLYRRSSILAHKKLNKNEDAQIRKMFEAALVAQIEMAESGGNLDIKATAYDHYLDLNPNGPRALEVRYQRARVDYDKNLHAKAADRFRAVALTKTQAQPDLRKKAADLALDSLVLAKRETEIEEWATELAEKFPKARVEYLNIARRAILKEVAAVSGDARSSESEIKRATKRLREINLEGTSKEERLLIFKNHLVLAGRSRDLDETERAAARVLSLKNASAADRESALEKQVWVAEMRLDFRRAYDLSRRMEMPKLRDDDRELRLAYLAELAGRPAGRHYEAVLATTKQRAKQELAATRLIRSSGRPWREIARHEGVLRRNRDLYASLVLEAFALTRDAGQARRYVKDFAINRREAGKTLARALEFKSIDAFDRQIANHRLTSASDRLLNVSLTRRLALLKEADARAQEAIRARDWTLQAILLSIVARENARLYGEVMALPSPRKLTPAQKKQYGQTLAAQAAPFKAKAKEVEEKLSEFWSNEEQIDEIARSLKESSGGITKVLAEEARQLARRSPSDVRRTLERAIETAFERPSSTELASARMALARNPFSERQAEKLKRLEQKVGREAMVTYLDARLTQMRGATL